VNGFTTNSRLFEINESTSHICEPAHKR
jgi:hypothetical protein